MGESVDAAHAATRAQWLQHPPSAQHGDPRFAFRSVSYHWINNNPRSRENTMRDALQQMFGKPFPKARPAWLRNPATGRPLEFDAYNADLKIAAEFHGIQVL
jgi:hypothetical protein